ncbi:MAG: DDE-type integrase/transposase/recombinase [Deltaproteobacteria bacterium]|nr:DDE-type integrase/transposase/recombinase [Deltaproteobacteria bacterium]
MEERHDPGLDQALCRCEVPSAYVALAPGRGQRGPLLRQLAERTWTGPHGRPIKIAAETIRAWVRRYRRTGLDGLRDVHRAAPGTKALTPEQVDLLHRLKREVPERSLDRLIRIAEDMKLMPEGVLKRSTVHRVLKVAGLSGRGVRVADHQDLDRFEADCANDLWQSDMLTGPWLPSPDREGGSKRAYLYAFLDDYSRLVLHGRFSFKGHLPALELVFRRCLQKWGVCRRAYFDNGAVYRSEHVRQIVAILGMYRISFTKPYRPMGHGKIEAFNRLVRSSFLAELKVSSIRTLDQLNEAFLAWADDYNRKVHSETGQAPLDRWRADIARVRYADDEALRQAFLWREERTPDKAGLFSLLGVRYQVGAGLGKRRVEVRYDPEMLDEVEVWLDGKMRERVRPFQVHTHRRPRPADPEPALTAPGDGRPSADWLGHLVGKRAAKHVVEASPRALAEQALARRDAADRAVADLLAQRLDPAVFDADAVRDFLQRYGPLDPERAGAALDRLLASGRPDQHISVYLEALLRDAGGES